MNRDRESGSAGTMSTGQLQASWESGHVPESGWSLLRYLRRGEISMRNRTLSGTIRNKGWRFDDEQQLRDGLENERSSLQAVLDSCHNLQLHEAVNHFSCRITRNCRPP